MTAVAAIDFGASSIRVCRVDLGARPPEVEVVHRYPHAPVRDPAGRLRWDWTRLVAEAEKGLVATLERGPVGSIGVDTWGVDYGLLDERGDLLSPPYCYRDRRTDGWRSVVERIGERRLYSITGLQLQPFNTLFQVAAHDRDELRRAHRLLLLPDLLVHHLTGAVLAERSIAGTTGLVDVHTGTWSDDLAASVGLDPGVLAPLAPATTAAGSWRDIPVHLVGGHDTASAVVAIGAAPGVAAAFVSAGTWLLVGREQPHADLGEPARRANFSNEPGALGGYRFLKNVPGYWLIEQCRPAWAPRAAQDVGDVGDLLAAARRVPPGPVADLADPRLLAPEEVLGVITSSAGLPRTAPAAHVVRCIVDSMAAAERGGDRRDRRRRGDLGAGRRVPRRALPRNAGRPDRGSRAPRPGRGHRHGKRHGAGCCPGRVRRSRRCPHPPPGGERVSIESMDRLERIEEVLRSSGRARVGELAAELDVSEMTIRRDLDLLVEHGVAQRIRGGAIAIGPQPFAERFGRNAKAKERIAAKLVDLVGDGGAIGVDASSTLQRLAGRISSAAGLTVVTNGPDTFATLHQRAGVTALLTGGQLDRRTGSLVGPLATRAARDLLLRVFCASAAGIDPVRGTSEATLEEAEVKLSLADVAGEVVIAVDSTKLGHRAPAAAFRPDRIACLVTELEPADPRLDPYRERWRLR